ncbi:MAG: mucoidy inhibitor MuiA family protein [Nannocystales bacterium]
MSDATSIELPITQVTVLEDRALVTRSGSVELPAGLHTLCVPDVAAVVVDKTLSAQASAGGRVVQARVVRHAATTKEAQRDRVAHWMGVETERRSAVEDTQFRFEVSSEALAATREVEALLLAELSQDIALGRDVSKRLAAIAMLREKLGEAVDARVDSERRRIRAQRALSEALRMQESIDDETRSVVGQFELEIQVEADGPSSIELTLRYAVGGALWRPAHVATLQPEGGVLFEAQACVWQATGEDWTDAEVSFSTERPSLGSTAPRLETDTLSLKAKTQAVSVQARDQVISTTGEGAAEVRDEMPGVDDGGEPVALKAEGPRTVSSNGRPHHVPLFSFESEARTELVCRPEKVEAVLLRTTQTHHGPHPLLAGPVELRRYGGFVGRTSTLFVAPGESFELGWGPNPDLRVHRKVEPAEHTRKPLSSWVRKPRTVRVTISNLGAQPHEVRLQERVVVSEIDKVEVEVGPLQGGTRDADGIVAKTLEVRGFGETTYAFEWTLVVHDDVRGM